MDRSQLRRSNTILTGRGLLRTTDVDLNPDALAIYLACPFQL
jgi:hypothetical protein